MPQFNLTNNSTTVVLPSSIVGAAAALGNSSIIGSATLKVDATGATPASVAAPPITINAPIPSPVPAAGLTLNLPATPGTVGPFTATGGAISLTVDPAVSLTLVVSGSNLNLTCTPYPNNSAATGIVANGADGGQGLAGHRHGDLGWSHTDAHHGRTDGHHGRTDGHHGRTVHGTVVAGHHRPRTAPVARGRGRVHRAVPRLGRPGPGGAASEPAPTGAAAGATGPARHRHGARRRSDEPDDRPPRLVGTASSSPSAKPAYPKAGGSPGLWFDGWEPQGRDRD